MAFTRKIYRYFSHFYGEVLLFYWILLVRDIGRPRQPRKSRSIVPSEGVSVSYATLAPQTRKSSSSGSGEQPSTNSKESSAVRGSEVSVMGSCCADASDKARDLATEQKGWLNGV
ncbi:hypothetical protein VNO80_02931 [Phaseolus coccineus]|uniref:Uncharacterized protein n=1 Tax=Phaseolus coccineus TaxID=3886 RepID=A0AAN9NQJ4_PHACN